uniref:Uncharacterized protein n=1 Tax=Ciona intestinalis TaxID=7719 RepID=F6UM93_CIOIN
VESVLQNVQERKKKNCQTPIILFSTFAVLLSAFTKRNREIMKIVQYILELLDCRCIQ